MGGKIDRDSISSSRSIQIPRNVNGEWFCEGFFFSIKDISAYQWISKCIVRLNWYASIHINRSETRCLYPQWMVINVCSSNFYIIISALKRTNANALRFIGSFDTTKEKWTIGDSFLCRLRVISENIISLQITD